MSSSTTPNPPLTLIIRFTTSLPDLPLTIPSPKTTTPQTLHALIRPALPPPFAAAPLRLIHAGALLPPNTAIHTSLRLSPTGKSPASIYVHCSVSTDRQLSSEELERERRAGGVLRAASASGLSAAGAAGAAQNDDAGGEEGDGRDAAASFTINNTNNTNSLSAPPPQPLGFDRLLAAGLSAAEISALRSQFRAVQAHAHTPDTMPSAPEMRLLEERWLDSGPSSGGGGGGAADEDGDGLGGGGSLEDMLWGNVMGFFWAVGAVVWLVREEGVWSKRRRVGVVTGVLVNVAFCVLRVGV